MTDDCTFCAIVAGDREADVVYEDDGTVAFLDIRPLFPGHVLVVPREHIVTIDVVPEAAIAPLFLTVRRLAGAVRRAVGAEGIFIAQNNVVSQSVPHLHVHVVPRRRGDGLRGFFWPRTGYDDEDHKARIRAAIRAEVAD